MSARRPGPLAVVGGAWQRHQRFVRFVVAAGASVPVNIVARIIVSQWVRYEFAVLISHVVGMLTAYLLTKLFVFDDSGRTVRSELSRFALVNVMSATLTWCVSVGLVHVVFPAIGFTFQPELLGHVIGLAIASVASFVGHSRFSFARDSAPPGIARTSRWSDSSPAATSHRQLLLFFIVLLAASTRRLLWSYWQGTLLAPESPLMYQAATLGFNYFELGAIRRGLGGSIVYLLSDKALLGTVYFHLLAAAAVAIGACLVLARLRAPPLTRATYALVMIAIMLRWGEDAGRTDAAVAALLAFAAHAMAQRRLVLACAWIGVGLFIHESSVIFGVPLLAALALGQGWASLPRRAWWGGAGVLALALAAYLTMVWLPHTSIGTMVDVVRSKFVPNKIADWAVYFAVSGARGVRTSICQNLADPTYLLHPVGGLVVLALAAAALCRNPRRDWPAMALATLPPFVFLAVVANDASRWTNFASFNLWLLLVSRPPPRVDMRIPRWVAPIAAVLFLLFSHPRPYKLEFPIYAGSPLIEGIARELGGPRTPGVEDALQHCDPEWRDVLNRAPHR